MLDRFAGIVEVHQVVAEIHTTCRTGTHAENGFQQLCTSGTHQAIQTKNFALAHIKADILQIRRIFGGQMLDGQDRIPGDIVHRREAAFQRTANHGGDQLAHVGVLTVLGHNQVAVTQNRNLVTNFKNFVHLM